MPGLRDIAPLKVEVDFGGTKIGFAGLSVADIFELSDRYETFRFLIESGSAALTQKLRDAPGMLREFPQAVWAAIAISTGERGDKEAEKAAARQPLSVQLQMVEAVMRATFREGIGPFVETISRMNSGSEADADDDVAERGERTITETLASAICGCVSGGLAAREAWSYTPRQLSAYLEYFEQERRRRMLDLVTASRVAAADEEHFRRGVRMIAGGAL